MLDNRECAITVFASGAAISASLFIYATRQVLTPASSWKQEERVWRKSGVTDDEEKREC
jgi:hypothetical protein